MRIGGAMARWPGSASAGCGRLHARLVGGLVPDESEDVLTGLRALMPALSGLVNTLAKTLPRRQAA